MTLPPALGIEISRRIRQTREKRGLSQKDVATRMHYQNHSYISRYESGRHTPNISTLYALATALQCDVKELLP